MIELSMGPCVHPFYSLAGDDAAHSDGAQLMMMVGAPAIRFSLATVALR
jgi:hypothetical protein